MRLFITAALLLIAALSFAQDNEKKAKEAIKEFIKKEKGITGYEEIIFGPLEEFTGIAPSAESQELKEQELRLEMEKLFQQTEEALKAMEGMDSTAQTTPGPDPQIKQNEVVKKKQAVSKIEGGYKILHMYKIRLNRESWKTVAAVFYLDKSLSVVTGKELKY